MTIGTRLTGGGKVCTCTGNAEIGHDLEAAQFIAILKVCAGTSNQVGIDCCTVVREVFDTDFIQIVKTIAIIKITSPKVPAK